MESTLADIRQLYNVKTIKYETEIADLAEGEFAIIEEGKTKSIAAAIVWATLPARFYLVAMIGGKLVYSFDTIEKAKMRNRAYKAYSAGQVNIWEATLEGCGCDCLKSVTLNIHIDEANINMQNGMSWTNRDSLVELAPKELACLCDCEGMPVYQNHLFTQLLVNRINADNSPYYEAESAISITGIATAATAPPALGSEVKGDLYVRSGSTLPGLYVYNGSAWKLVGNATGTISDMATYIENTKDLNMGTTVADFTPKLQLVLKGKAPAAGNYRDLENDYVATRGVRITPTWMSNGGTNAGAFTETQDLRFALGEGSDLRLEEWENMNFYTDLNFYPRLTDGIASRKLTYQFENGVNYDGLVFEFTTPKVERNTGESRLFSIYLGVKTGEAESARLEEIFMDA